MLNTAPKQGSNAASFLEEVREGVRRLFANSTIRPLLLILMPVMLVIGMLMTNYKGLLIDEFQLDALSYGWAETRVGGALRSAAVRPVQAGRPDPGSLWIVALAGFAALLLPDWRSAHGLLPVMIWSIVIGFGESLLHVPASNLLLTHMPEEIRGRGIALSTSMMSGVS